MYESYYADEPFVHVAPAAPSTKQTLGSNACIVYPMVDPMTNEVMVISAIDNLVKGTAGGAIQCLNLMFGLPEELGLSKTRRVPMTTASATTHDALSADPSAEGAVTRPQGFSACGFTAGIKESGLPDLALLVSDRPATAAAVFTQNQSTAAPVHISKAHCSNGTLRAAVVNSGNANCATGAQGLADAREMAQLAAALTGCEAEDVFVNSTGIIGHYLPMDLLRAAIPQLEPATDGGEAFARSIMTTDTFQKESVATFESNGISYTIGGCAKGAGMIHPDMATMLAFFSTDAPVASSDLDAAFRHAMDRSINMVTVDGDTSTNDSAVILANGAAGGDPLVGRGVGVVPRCTGSRGDSAGQDDRPRRRGCEQADRDDGLGREIVGGRPRCRPDSGRLTAAQGGVEQVRPQLGPDPDGGRPRRRPVRPGPGQDLDLGPLRVRRHGDRRARGGSLGQDARRRGLPAHGPRSGPVGGDGLGLPI